MFTQQINTDIHYLVGNMEDLQKVEYLPALPIFSEEVLELLDALSAAIMNDKDIRNYPDVMTFGFWCRKAALSKQRELYNDGYRYLGRGLVFHIAPSNLPVIFAYTLIAGLLAGNANVVRVPSKEFWQIEYICKRFSELLATEKFRGLSPYIACVRYDHSESTATKRFSARCDVRVIWGSDNTITAVRKSALKPKAFEIIFADRYSLCVIDSDAWLNCTDKKRHIKGFYNDTYLNDQNACSSPQLVLWLGANVQEARTDFWNLLEQMVMDEYPLQGIQSVIKLEAFYRMIDKFPALRLDSKNNYIVRVWSREIEPGLMEYRPGSGFFIESSAEDISALAPLLGTKCQTLSYYGIAPAAFNELLERTRPLGIDRIVPIGNTLDFSLTWDGYDLIRTLSRKINIV